MVKLWAWLLIGMGSVVLIGCGPAYPEGPSVSFRSVEDRVTGKWEWTIARRVERGQEINLTPQVRDNTIEIKEDGTLQESLYDLSGEWALVSRKKELNLVFLTSPDSIGIPDAIAFEIRRLKQNEMWLHFTDDSLQVEWQLSRVGN